LLRAKHCRNCINFLSFILDQERRYSHPYRPKFEREDGGAVIDFAMSCSTARSSDRSRQRRSAGALTPEKNRRVAIDPDDHARPTRESMLASRHDFIASATLVPHHLARVSG
jgi:hypothetical protein